MGMIWRARRCSQKKKEKKPKPQTEETNVDGFVNMCSENNPSVLPSGMLFDFAVQDKWLYVTDKKMGWPLVSFLVIRYSGFFSSMVFVWLQTH